MINICQIENQPCSKCDFNFFAVHPKEKSVNLITEIDEAGTLM